MMENRMKKGEILELLGTLKIHPEEFWILSSGGLVLRGILPDARDLDIAVTDKGLEELKQNYDLKYKENGWFVLSDKVEGICDGKKEELKYQPQKIGKYYVQNIDEYMEYLKQSDRQKDKDRIELVQKYINSSDEVEV